MSAATTNLWRWGPVTDSLLDAWWVNQLARYRTLFVGFSGGLDSTVLLHNLASQPNFVDKLSAVHIHHGLSPNADAWLAHCQAFCVTLSTPLIVSHVAIERRVNIEASARKARYEVFEHLLGFHDVLLLAHHADDQAETLLLQLFRGAGIDGMAAMPAVKSLGSGEMARPFLQHSRKALEVYADLHQLTWVDDESNQNSRFSRNYLRHQVMPLLRARWPGVVTNLVRTAGHCQQAKINLQALAEMDIRAATVREWRTNPTAETQARLANILRNWLQNNPVRMPSTDIFKRLISDVILANKDANPCVEWDGVCVRRYKNTLYLLKAGAISSRSAMEWSMFPEPLQMSGDCLRALPKDKGLQVLPSSKVDIRFRQGGELLHWRGQTKSLKQLLQQWQVPPWQRDRLPLVYINDELAAVVGFAISDRHYGINLAHGYHIELRETRLQEHTCLNL